MTKKPVKRYTVDGKPMTPEDLRRLHDYLVDMDTIAIISDEMRVVVENEWPELAHKLPSKMIMKNDQFALNVLEALVDAREMIPLRGTYFGRSVGEQPTDEAEHFIRCPGCGGWIDCRDLGQVFEHEGPLPHPPQDQPQ
jgi:hypothetical protein